MIESILLTLFAIGFIVLGAKLLDTNKPCEHETVFLMLGGMKKNGRS